MAPRTSGRPFPKKKPRGILTPNKIIIKISFAVHLMLFVCWLPNIEVEFWTHSLQKVSIMWKYLIPTKYLDIINSLIMLNFIQKKSVHYSHFLLIPLAPLMRG